MTIKKFLLLASIILFFDFFWIYFFIGPKFNVLVKNIQGENIKPNFIGIILSYLFFIFGIYYFGFLKNSYKDGIIFGILSFGIFDFTNLAIFKKYDISLALLDIFWGGFISYFSLYFLNNYLKV